jgi:hypothetical protein
LGVKLKRPLIGLFPTMSKGVYPILSYHCIRLRIAFSELIDESK